MKFWAECRLLMCQILIEGIIKLVPKHHPHGLIILTHLHGLLTTLRDDYASQDDERSQP